MLCGSGIRRAVVLCGVAWFIGTGEAQDRGQPAPKKCTCKITAEYTKASVSTNAAVKKMEVGIKGRVTSGPKSEEKIEPKIQVKLYLLHRVGGGAWTRVAGLQTATVELGPLTCGEAKSFDKTFTHPAGEIPIAGADGNTVDCELHLWAWSDDCEMSPVRAYVRFSFERGKKEETPQADLMKYNAKLEKKKVVAYVSGGSDQGWMAPTPMWFP